MISRTVTAVLEAPSADVFAFLSRVENLPAWATDFARELKYEDGKAKVVNGLGELYFRIDANPDTGVIDMFAGPDEAQMAIFPTRVVGLSPDRCAYTFTMFKAPDTPDELFEAQHRSLTREFENIRARFSPDAR
ncbi:MAG TPA: hypothetical protein VJ814_09680 [Gaiellaceae bacterium]|nr:hypothetical protein [Gaiellaceae bacterium]